MINEFIHGSISFVVRSKNGRTENLRRNHNWYAKGKDWKEANKKSKSDLRKNGIVKQVT